jgi:hypothetical protein
MRNEDQLTLEARNPAQFVEVVRARAPRGFSDAIREAAETRRISPSEFIRRALAEKLAGDIGERTINV